MRLKHCLFILYFLTGILGIIIITLNMFGIELGHLVAIYFLLFNISIQLLTHSIIKSIKKYWGIYLPLTFILTNVLISWISLILNVFTNFSIIYIYVLLSILLIGVIHLFFYNKNQKHYIKLQKEYLIAVLIILCSFVISQVIFHRDIPNYTTLNTDTLPHLTLIKEIFIKQNLHILLPQINKTFTVITYLPIFHYIFGIPISASTLPNFISTYMIIEKTFILFSGLVSFHILFYLSKKNLFIATLGTVMHLFMFESVSAYTAFFMLPQTVTGLMSFLIIGYLLQNEQLSKIDLIWLIILLGILFLTHFLVGIILILLVITIYIHKKLKADVGTIVYSTIDFLLFLAIAIVMITKINFATIGTLVFTDFTNRSNEFVVITGEQMVTELFRILGVYVIFILYSNIKAWFSKNKNILLIAILLKIVILTILLQIPYAPKLFIFFHYFIIILIVLELQHIKIQRHIWKYLILFWFLLNFICILPISSNNYTNLFQAETKKELINQYDYQIMNIIRTKYGTNNDVIIISDPLTMEILEPQIHQQTIGGIYASPVITENIWIYLNTQTNKEDLKQQIEDLYNNSSLKTVLVVTGRTEGWTMFPKEEATNYGVVVWHPRYRLIHECRANSNSKIISSSDYYCIIEL